MKNYLIGCSLFLLVCFRGMPLYGQTVGEEPVGIPDRYTYSADSLALYIDGHYRNDEAKMQAMYTWITSHMTYYVFPIFESVNEEHNDAKEVKRTLQVRKGVCRHFARVFQMVGDKMDIPTCFVEGYVKDSKGEIMNAPHAWCVAKISGKWYFYDPTFGMGYAMKQEFVAKPTMKYCKVSPDVAIWTHMPFDPIWQLLEHPYTYPAFDEGMGTVSEERFCFNDSIRLFLSQSPLQRAVSVEQRVERNGKSNPLVDYYKQINSSNIDVYRQREIYDVFKVALKQYNRGYDSYSELVRYHRNHFRPKKSQQEVERLMQSVPHYAEVADSVISKVFVPSSSPYALAMNNLKESIRELKGKIPLLEKLMQEKMR